MNRSRIGPAVLGGAALVGVLGSRAMAQRLEDHGSVVGGAEFRSVRFGEGLGVNRVQQLVFPAGLVIPAGRLSFDVGTSYASTTLEGSDGSKRTVSALTDTQIRAAYTFGRDFLVATAVVNLPTGQTKAPVQDFNLLGAVSSPFYGFPVSSYANGLSVTAALAAAVPAGEWNVGIAGSLRSTQAYTPYIDANGPFRYDPGIEGRVRIGADRIVGASRVTIGLTYSTLGTDELSPSGQSTSQYRPGKRWIGEVSLATAVGSGSAMFYGWHVRRSSGESVGVAIGNRESLTSGGVLGRWPLSSRLTGSLGVEGQLLSQDASSGKMIGASGKLEVGLSDRVVFEPMVRYDVGSVGPKSLPSSSVRGIYIAAFLRGLF